MKLESLNNDFHKQENAEPTFHIGQHNSEYYYNNSTDPNSQNHNFNPNFNQNNNNSNLNTQRQHVINSNNTYKITNNNGNNSYLVSQNTVQNNSNISNLCNNQQPQNTNINNNNNNTQNSNYLMYSQKIELNNHTIQNVVPSNQTQPKANINTTSSNYLPNSTANIHHSLTTSTNSMPKNNSSSNLLGISNSSLPRFGIRLPNRSPKGAILSIHEQPVEEHRARYESEGNRGVIKSQDQSTYPTIKLSNYKINEDPSGQCNPGIVTLKIFCVRHREGSNINHDSNSIDQKPKPHRFFKPVGIPGKIVTPDYFSEDKEDYIDNAAGENYKFHVLTIKWDLKKLSGERIKKENDSKKERRSKTESNEDGNDISTEKGTTSKEEEIEYVKNQTEWLLPIDCLSILKLRVQDLQDNKSSTARRPKKCNSFFIKLCFRLSIFEQTTQSVSNVMSTSSNSSDFLNESNFEENVIQISSSPINCKQPEGMPEIIRMSHTNSYQDKPAFYCDDDDRVLWIYGRNFALKNTKVTVSELDLTKNVKWSQEATFVENNSLDILILNVPDYCQAANIPVKDVKSAVQVKLTITVGRKSKDTYFYYLPKRFEHTKSVNRNFGLNSNFRTRRPAEPVRLTDIDLNNMVYSQEELRLHFEKLKLIMQATNMSQPTLGLPGQDLYNLNPNMNNLETTSSMNVEPHNVTQHFSNMRQVDSSNVHLVNNKLQQSSVFNADAMNDDSNSRLTNYDQTITRDTNHDLSEQVFNKLKFSRGATPGSNMHRSFDGHNLMTSDADLYTTDRDGYDTETRTNKKRRRTNGHTSAVTDSCVDDDKHRAGKN